jgi:hypothetical protein
MIMSRNKHTNETTATSNRGTSLSNGENVQDNRETKTKDQKEAEARKIKLSGYRDPSSSSIVIYI